MVIVIAHIKGAKYLSTFCPEDAPGGDVLDDGRDEAALGGDGDGNVDIRHHLVSNRD